MSYGTFVQQQTLTLYNLISSRQLEIATRAYRGRGGLVSRTLRQVIDTEFPRRRAGPLPGYRDGTAGRGRRRGSGRRDV